jgi:tol-pal system protein YbgF
MNARGLVFAGAALPWLLLGCVVEQRDFEALREQVRLQQKQINDLKARQEDQALRLETLNNGFKILGDKAEENSRRIDDVEERGPGLLVGSAPAAAPAAAPLPATPAQFPPPVSPAPAAAPPPAQEPPAVQPPPATPAPLPATVSAARPEPVLLTNLPRKEAPEAAPPKKEVSEPPAGDQIITTAPRAEKLYASALALFSNREYPEATGKFREFVAEFPDHKLAGNAQYWIGECHYTQRRFGEAAEEFAKVERDFPASPKVPASLYKKGLSLWELKRTADAQATLQHLVDTHPQSEEAGKAREKLERWKKP